MKNRRLMIPALLLLLASACSLKSTPGPTPTQTNPPPPTSTPLAAATDTPNPTPEPPSWEDRSVFSANLTAASQDVLQQLPQASVYHIDLRIPDDLTQPIEGRLEVRYFNQEDVQLDRVVFRLFANYNGGQIQISSVEVDHTPAESQLNALDTVLLVSLMEPLDVGQSVVIGMDFNLSVPTEMGGNYGLLSFIDGILVLDTFYPMIPVYDQNGWYEQVPSPNGDLTYNDMSFYLVSVDAPEDLTLVASGSLVERSTSSGRQLARFAAGPVRDFYLAGSRDFTVLSTTVGETTINSYALIGNEQVQQQVLDYLQAGMAFFNQTFGDYPYAEFDAISSPMAALGIEYPGVVGILKDLYEREEPIVYYRGTDLLEIAVIHELAHQWFYNLVGSNQQSEPWVDEALTQFSVYLYMQGVYGEVQADGRLDEWNGRWSQVNGKDIPVGMPVGDYSGQAYGAIVYGRGPLFLYTVGEQIGADTLLQALVSYYQDNRWGIADTESVRRSLEQACQCDLSDLFEEWVYP